MPGLDTHVLVRWLVEDDTRQVAKAQSLFDQALVRQQTLFVPSAVSLELEWVLRSRYQLDKGAVVRAFSALLEAQELEFQDEAALERALHRYRQGSADFADCLHACLCSTAGHAPLLSFDEKAARLVDVERIV